MFVNRGMIEAAQTEGEVAGVMAHELSHVVLRHGTAQATKAQKYQIGAVAGADHRRHRRRHRRAASSRRARSSASAPLPEVQPRVREAGRPRWARRSWRAPATTRATWRRCSRRSEAGRLARAAVAEQPPRPRQPLRVHHAGGAGAARPGQPDRDTGQLAVGEGGAAADAAGADHRADHEERRSGTARAGRRRAARTERRARAARWRRTSSRRRAASGPTTWATCSACRVPDNWRQLPGNNSVTVRARRRLRRRAGPRSSRTASKWASTQTRSRRPARRRPTRWCRSFAQGNPQLRQDGNAAAGRRSPAGRGCRCGCERVGSHRHAGGRHAHDGAARRWQPVLQHRRGAGRTSSDVRPDAAAGEPVGGDTEIGQGSAELTGRKTRQRPRA